MGHIFYMVTVDGSSQPPTKRYDDQLLAQKEAERLVIKEGRPAYLLQSVAMVVPPPCVWAQTTPKGEPQS